MISVYVCCVTQARMTSMFLWPALASSIMGQTEQQQQQDNERTVSVQQEETQTLFEEDATNAEDLDDSLSEDMHAAPSRKRGRPSQGK